MVPHHHLIGNLIHQYYINTTNIPTHTTIRQKNTLELSTCVSSFPSNYYHLNHHHNHHSILDVGSGWDGRVASKNGLLLGPINMLVFDLLTVSMPVARGSSIGVLVMALGSW